MSASNFAPALVMKTTAEEEAEASRSPTDGVLANATLSLADVVDGPGNIDHGNGDGGGVHGLCVKEPKS